jgi:peptidoglycan/xylan/chitin deacetylase (PgdA/CDA1 family)
MATSAILLYHRVAEPPTDPWWLAVSSRNFAAQLDVLRRRCDVVPLSSLPDRSGGARPRVAITFDDGYVDNLTNAGPELAERGLTATVFVVSTPLHEGAEFWWDRIDRLVLRTPSLPHEFVLEAENGPLRWPVPELDPPHGTDGVQASWRAWEAPLHDRQRLYLELYNLLFAAAPDERRSLIGKLAVWGGPAADESDLQRAMTTSELRDLAAVPGIEIGAHTQSHPRLADLPLALQEQEIVGSRRALEDVLDRPVSSFAYPFGRRSDYTDETADLVHQASFDLACSNERGLITAGTNRLQLPRLQVHDWDAAEFERWLVDSLADGR